MSRALARQKLQTALDALRCARTNVDEAVREYNFQHDQEIAQHTLNLASAGIEEIHKCIREAISLSHEGIIRP